jgi:hypothetical protein
VDSKTALYVDQQLDPLRLAQAVDGQRITELEKKVTAAFALINGGKKAGLATAGGTGIAGVVYVVVEILKGAPQ